jgi:hypothetical protein
LHQVLGRLGLHQHVLGQRTAGSLATTSTQPRAGRGLEPEVSAAVAAASVLGGDFTPDVSTLARVLAGSPATVLDTDAVARIVAKLQLANRTELAAWVLRGTPAP